MRGRPRAVRQTTEVANPTFPVADWLTRSVLIYNCVLYVEVSVNVDQMKRTAHAANKGCCGLSDTTVPS